MVGGGAYEAQAIVADGAGPELAGVGHGVEGTAETLDFEPVGRDRDQTLWVVPISEFGSGKDQVLGAAGTG